MTPSKKRNSIVAVFAHPDDEAFGPAGTIAKFSQTHDVYVLCATRGEAGSPRASSSEAGGNHKRLSEIRSSELLKSAKILGVRGVYFLGFVDGTLSNSHYHHLASKIEQKLKLFKPQTLITFEPRGVSGHIDHVTVSMVTTYVFYKLPFVKTLLYYCITARSRQMIKDYFIYFPPGYKRSEIDKVVDISDVWEKKVAAMACHQSQIKDARPIIERLESFPKEEYFLTAAKK